MLDAADQARRMLRISPAHLSSLDFDLFHTRQRLLRLRKRHGQDAVLEFALALSVCTPDGIPP
jgi:hypothetical protein